jgi:hypothetical protein
MSWVICPNWASWNPEAKAFILNQAEKFATNRFATARFGKKQAEMRHKTSMLSLSSLQWPDYDLSDVHSYGPQTR